MPILIKKWPALCTLLLQLTLRLKVLKRQLDESEEEIERLENSKKKFQRELDEQQEINEQLHSQISALKTDLRSHINSMQCIHIAVIFT